MENSQILNIDFNIITKNLPKNIYALRVFDVDNDIVFDIIVRHEGYCPKIDSEREQSKFNDYLSNLEYKLIDEYYKSAKLIKPKNYFSKIEIMTDANGELYQYSKSIN